MIQVMPLVDETLPDAERIVRGRFPVSAIAILHKVMRNPMRRRCVEAGDIAYEDGTPVGFQACEGRRLNWQGEEKFANVGGMTVLSPDASVEALIDIKAAARKNRFGHCMGFGNTLCAVTEKMARKAKVHLGPESCCWHRFRPIRLFTFVCYCVRRKILKLAIPRRRAFNSLVDSEFTCECSGVTVRRLMGFEREFDDFWSQYIKLNKGLACSRTAEELNWIFGEEVKNGTVALLGAYRFGALCGFIVLKDSQGMGVRWQIMDWIAIGNEIVLLDALLSAAVVFLRKKTPAMLLESIGFPTFIQPVLRKHLPYRRFAGNNFFSYGYRKPKAEGKEFAEACEAVIDSEKSWFFGPYDGDMCM